MIPRAAALVLAAVALALGYLLCDLGTARGDLDRVAAAAGGACAPDPGWPAERPDLARRVLELVNDHRGRIGLPPVSASATLTATAVWKARHMAAYAYMGHADPAPPVARSTAQRFSDCGYPANAGWGENVAYGYPTPDYVMSGWLGSAGHRANIENPSFRALGVGAAVAPDGTVYWTQAFGTIADTAPPPPAPAPPAVCDQGGRADRARCHLRELIVDWRAAGRSWSAIKQTHEWRAYQLLGGT